MAVVLPDAAGDATSRSGVVEWRSNQSEMRERGMSTGDERAAAQFIMDVPLWDAPKRA
ncbi:MAG: hypothetical protein M3160_02375 [Candidatus Eremiobacteraeota bacterium]|nr:hypothetical protein [Candidatus Eremiobacteraeota bacterium]